MEKENQAGIGIAGNIKNWEKIGKGQLKKKAGQDLEKEEGVKLDRKAQSVIEVTILSSVIMLLFLMVVVTVLQKNAYTSLVEKNNKNMQQCHNIATLIASMHPNPAYTETKMTLLGNTRIEKGSINIEDNYCYYTEEVSLQTAGGASPAYTSDIAGFDLNNDHEYKIKKTSYGVVFCNASETWC